MTPRPLRLLPLLLLATGPFAAGTARADAGASTRTKGPCDGCLTVVPASAEPAPVLVVLHGDGETPASVLSLWEPEASARGIVVFAPACPRDLGCTAQSWWKWSGDPAWLRAQLDAVGAMHPLDPSRRWIAGWSGGGTYIGWNTQDLERDFAALVVHGGGVRPASARCPERPAGVYFLGGDRNPLHGLAEQLHAFYAVTCPHADLTWTVLPGVDHEGERRAMARYRGAILEWMAGHARAAAETASASPASASAPAPATASATASATAPRACMCSMGPAGPAPLLLALVPLAAIARRRSRGTGRDPRGGGYCAQHSRRA